MATRAGQARRLLAFIGISPFPARGEYRIEASRTFEPPDPGGTTEELRRAWDIIADQEPTTVVLRFTPDVAARVMETRWHPTQAEEQVSDGSLIWRATVAGVIEIRLWVLSWGDDVEVLEQASLRADVAATHARAAARYAGTTA